MEYKDGGLRCKNCKVKLVAKLPKEKISKKREFNHNTEVKKTNKKIKTLITVFIAISSILFFMYFMGFYIFKSFMSIPDASLLGELMIYFLELILFIFISIGLYISTDIWSNGGKMSNKDKIIKLLVKRISPVIMIILGIFNTYAPMMDFIKRDYIYKYGIVTAITMKKSEDYIY
ncbi:hypothetical protein IAI10_23115 [Clostridium sp. 19966]|uniref:hypothetical protein n=1 Tax=Clostridium sp. 19966 TaxID=2768166 RepID=UPI0028DEDEA5|nr:hypothetical protein [Clostridium sp. 19966]MDT8719540.1 hypothetical protein [Clostridium sp. 19966]